MGRLWYGFEVAGTSGESVMAPFRGRLNAEQQAQLRIRDQEIVQARIAGEPLKSLSLRHGVCTMQILRICKAHGVIKRPQVRLSFADRQEVVRLYESNVLGSEIARRFGIGEETVRRFVRAVGLPVQRSIWIPSDKDVADMVEAYGKEETTREIGHRYHVTHGYVAKILRCAGVPIRKSSDAKRIYHHDAHAFDNATENPDALYHLGLLMADGCVGDTYFFLSLSNDDRDHVKELQKFLKTDQPLYYSEAFIDDEGQVHNKKAVLHISSPELLPVLASYGIIPRKSCKEHALDGIEHSADFWRGCVDGDGCLRWSDRKTARVASIDLCGGIKLMEQFRSFAISLRKEGKYSHPTKHAGTWRIAFRASVARSIIETLYCRPGPALPRKKALAQEMLALTDEFGHAYREGYKRLRCLWRWVPRGYLLELISLAGSEDAAARLIGMPSTSLRRQARDPNSQTLDLLKLLKEFSTIPALARYLGCQEMIIESVFDWSNGSDNWSTFIRQPYLAGLFS
jgi:hypothetical protein